VCAAVGSTTAPTVPAGETVFSGPPAHPWVGTVGFTSAQAWSDIACQSSSHCVLVGDGFVGRLA
jgi:hypothetical protein